MRYIDLTGQQFGRLKVLSIHEKAKHGKSIKWLCSCVCGKTTVALSYKLRNGRKRSCGCLHHDVLVQRNYKHGLAHKHKLYSVWNGMKERCANPNNNRYHCYGGRGIAVCENWINSFENFYNWAIENGYKEGLSIDRINNNGNYELSNCRWTTVKEQANNRRTNKTPWGRPPADWRPE